MLAACTGESGAAAGVRQLRADTFDSFAGSFDKVLDTLGYRAPGLIGELLDETSRPPMPR